MSRVRSLLIWIFLVCCSQPVAARAQVEVRVDPRVELVTLVARLAGFKEFTMANSASPYATAAEKHFAPVAAHAAVKRLQELRAAQGVSYDAIASFAVHLDGLESLGELVPFDLPPERLDARWGGAKARTFLAELRDFSKSARAAEFFASQREFYAEVERRLGERLSQSKALPWFDQFFGARTGAKYVAVPGLLCGGGNFGVGVRFPDGRPELITPVFGCWEWDEQGVPIFSEAYLPLFIHELAHSYTNPIVDRHAEALADAGRRLYATCEAQMRKQAYGTAQTMLYESLVRASVVRCTFATEGKTAAEAIARDDVSRGFAWVPELAKLLGDFEAARDQWPTFEAFLPRVVAFFDEQAKRVEEQAARAPKVLSVEPANGAQDVDPALTQLVIRFDRPMRDQTWSIVGSKTDVPEIIGTIAYDAERKVLTVPIKMQPGRTYRIGLNSAPRNMSFVSADGTPLAPLEVTFTTRAR